MYKVSPPPTRSRRVRSPHHDPFGTICKNSVPSHRALLEKDVSLSSSWQIRIGSLLYEKNEPVSSFHHFFADWAAAITSAAREIDAAYAREGNGASLEYFVSWSQAYCFQGNDFTAKKFRVQLLNLNHRKIDIENPHDTFISPVLALQCSSV